MIERFLEVEEQTIAITESEGAGPPVLMVHSNSLSGESFFAQLDSDLGKRYRLVAMDLPGHGRSKKASDPAKIYSSSGYGSIIAGTILQLDMKEPVLVGHSLGGHLLLEESPATAKGICIFGTPPLGVPPAPAEAFLPNPALGASFKGELSDEEISALAASFFQDGTTPPQFVFDNIRKTDPAARATVGAALATGNFKDEIALAKGLTCPLAIIHGANDSLVNLEYIRALSLPTLWRGEVQIIEGAGHSPQLEASVEFNRLLTEFLEDVHR